MPKHAHILNAASNLLGIAFVIIAGLKVTRMNEQSLADEIAWAAAICLSLSCILSYVSIRAEPNGTRAETWADRIFLAGLVALFARDDVNWAAGAAALRLGRRLRPGGPARRCG